jgi:nucleotide-binding universal stress UspA family protein
VNGPIVAGTDGSETANVAISEAIDIAKAFGLPLHVVSAYRPASVKVPAEFQGSITPHSHVEALLDEVASRARVAGVDVETHMVVGDPADAIIDLAERVGAGLILIGNRGIGSAKRFVLGNVPSKVVHHSPCSTYVVHTAGG